LGIASPSNVQLFVIVAAIVVPQLVLGLTKYLARFVKALKNGVLVKALACQLGC
jgi:hypothetical protein